MKHRILATALALGMALSLVPAALAEETAPVADGQAVAQSTAETAMEAEPVTPAEAPAAEPEAAPEAAEPAAPAEVAAAAEAMSEQPTEPETPAEEPVTPELTGVEVAYNNGASIVTAQDGSFWLDADNATKASDYTVTLTLSDGAAFTPTGHTEGNVYVAEATADSVKLRFDLTVEDVDIDRDDFALYLTSTDGTTWSGSFAQAGDLTVQQLGYYLSQQTLTLPAGSLGAGSAAQSLVVNQDADSSMLILCAPDATVYNVTYVYSDNAITWKLLPGMTIPNISVEMTAGNTFDGWYVDADYTTALTGTVTGDMTIYGKVTTQAATGDFLEQLESGENVTIDSMEDWNVFVQNSELAKAGQVVTLGTDIDCGDATYDSMTFAGSFNGNGKTISNASFRAVSTASGDTCSGMFAKIGPGQTVANLTLQNVTAQYSGTYAGVLAGMVDGAGGSRALVQNVQVRNSSVSGRSAGGVAGFIRNATVRYCSSRDTTITGLANGGGIVGLSNAKVEYCYSTTRPTALPSLIGGSAGGVVGKNVRGAYTEYCWATMAVVGRKGTGTEAAGTDIGAFDNVSDSTTATQFVIAGFTQECWVRASGTATDFNPSVIPYTFE